MGGGGGGDPAAESRRQEEERQARIKAATEEINNIFSNKVKMTREVPFMGDGGGMTTETYWADGDPANARDTLYASHRGTVYDLNKAEVDRQAAQAERTNRFGLARAGLAGGSVDVDSTAELNRRTNEGLLRAGGIADQASADLKASDEKTRANLISMAQSGIDTGTASQMALQGLKVNADSVAEQRSGASIGGLFNDLSQAYLANQATAGRNAGTNYGQQWYGVSSPTQRYSGS
jgi:hypothetical protein